MKPAPSTLDGLPTVAAPTPIPAALAKQHHASHAERQAAARRRRLDRCELALPIPAECPVLQVPLDAGPRAPVDVHPVIFDEMVMSQRAAQLLGTSTAEELDRLAAYLRSRRG